jgi:hypothetical protein
MYRIEVWCNKSAPEEDLKRLKETVRVEFGSEVIEKTMD